jgi:hypothetical protein
MHIDLKHIPFFFRNSCRFRISHFENSLHAFKECGFECTGHITSSEFQFAFVSHSVPFPPFSLVLNFVKEISKIRNDPSFSYLYEQQAQKPNIGSRPALSQKSVIARKMEVKSETKANWNSDEVMCPVHSRPLMSFYCPIQIAPFSRCALQLNVSHFDNEHTLQIVYSLSLNDYLFHSI